MRILSIRRGFQADHSSTSYEFYAVDKPLDSKARGKVAALSSRARPTRHRVSFIYHGEWSDLPGSWKPLMKKYYDVMYSESYDWWTLAMAFDSDTKTIKKIREYAFDGDEEMGISVNVSGKRVIVAISCRMMQGMSYGDDYLDYDEAEDEAMDQAEPDDELLDLLRRNREYLKKGDCRLLYGIWELYRSEDEDSDDQVKAPPKPGGMNKLPKAVESLLSMLDTP